MDITYVSQGCVYILHTCSTIVSRSGPKITWYRVHDKTNNPFGDRDEDIDLFTQTHTHTRVVGKMKIDNVTPSQRYNRETIHFTQHPPPPPHASRLNLVGTCHCHCRVGKIASGKNVNHPERSVNELALSLACASFTR